MSLNGEQIQQLRQYFADGLSSGQTAKAMNVSRNSVIGYWHRLGLKRPQLLRNKDDAAQKRILRMKYRKVKPRGVVLPPPLKRDENEYTMPVTIIELDMMRHCRWPIGDPKMPSFRYCGAQREFPGDQNRCYCADHYSVSLA